VVPKRFRTINASPVPYPIRSIVQNRGLQNPLRNIITLKYDTTLSNYFTVSELLMRWMGLMKRYQFPNVWSKVTSVVNERPTRPPQAPPAAPCLLATLSNPTAPPGGGGWGGGVQPTLGTTAIAYIYCALYCYWPEHKFIVLLCTTMPLDRIHFQFPFPLNTTPFPFPFLH
jgi:hypothetical protein